MLDRSKFNAFFTDNFFVRAVRQELPDAEVSFPLPSSQENLRAFYTSDEGRQFRDGVRALVERLKIWAEKHRIDPMIVTESLDEFGIIREDIAPVNAFNKFYSDNFVNYRGALTEFNKKVFPLYTQGIPLLARIINLIELDTFPLQVRIIAIRFLIPGLIVCPPGIYENIYNTELKLTSDPKMVLMRIRTHLAQEAANKAIETHREEYALDENSETHQARYLLNESKGLGIEPIEDDYAQYGRMKKLVSTYFQLLPEFITPANVLLHLAKEINLSDWGKNLPSDHELAQCVINEMKEKLDKYGVDEHFNITNFLDEDALADGSYVISPTADFHLRITLLQRLLNTNYLDATQVCVYPIAPGISVYIPQHTFYFSYVADAEAMKKGKTRLPLLPYFCDAFNIESESKLTPDKKVENETKRKALSALILNAEALTMILQSLSQDNAELFLNYMDPSHLFEILKAPGAASIFSLKTNQKAKIKLLFNKAIQNSGQLGALLSTLGEAVLGYLDNETILCLLQCWDDYMALFPDKLDPTKMAKRLARFMLLELKLTTSKICDLVKAGENLVELFQLIHSFPLLHTKIHLEIIGSERLKTLIDNGNVLAKVAATLNGEENILLISYLGIEKLRSFIFDDDQTENLVSLPQVWKSFFFDAVIEISDIQSPRLNVQQFLNMLRVYPGKHRYNLFSLYLASHRNTSLIDLNNGQQLAAILQLIPKDEWRWLFFVQIALAISINSPELLMRLFNC